MDLFPTPDSAFLGSVTIGYGPLEQLAKRELFVVADQTGYPLEGLKGLLQQRGLAVHQLHDGQGLAELVVSLRGMVPEGGFEAIHLLSHGSPGQIGVGIDQLTGRNLEEFASQLHELGGLMAPEGDVLIYGCNVGEGADGAVLVDRFARLTGADIAASDDVTGLVAISGNQDWELEVTSGDVDLDRSAALAELGWQGTLAGWLLPIAKVLGEAVVGAFAGYAVEQALSPEKPDTTSNIVLQFGGGGEGAPDPINTGIEPNKSVKSALFLDSTGDLVDIRLEGSGTFKLNLSGGLTNLADVISLELEGVNESTNLSISVSPISQSINAGSATSANETTKEVSISGLYNRMYSPGYTNVDRIFSNSSSGKIGNIELTATIVNNIDLSGHDIASIELDTGYTTLVDRVNTTTLSSSSGISTSINGNTISGNTALDGEIVDFSIIDDNPILNGGGSNGSVYRPVTGLIDLGNVTARSLERLIINGSISANTGDPNDPSNTNDIRGVVDITGRIGNISAKRSRLDGTIQAGSIGKIDIGRIDGTVVTKEPSKPLSLTLPANFRGFVESAGHLNMAYTFYPIIGDPDIDKTPGPTLGRITSSGGISGINASELDPIFVPSGYNAIIENKSSLKGIADLRVNGTLSSRWISASNIGNISANTITAAAVIEAKGNIGAIQALRHVVVPKQVVDPDQAVTSVDLDGTFIAGGKIGDIRSARGIGADFRAENGGIGSITALSGGITSTLIEAKGDIGQISVQSQPLNNTKVVSKDGSIAGLKVFSGSWGGVIRAGQNVGNIYVEKGNLVELSLEARRAVGNITVQGSNTIVGGTYTAGSTMGTITAKAARGTAIQGALFQAGDENGQYEQLDNVGKKVNDQSGNPVMLTSSIAGFMVSSHGATLLPSVEAGMPAEPSVLPSQPPEVAAHGIDATQIIAGKIGAIRAQASTGSGIVGTPFVLPPDADVDPDELPGFSVIHAKVEDIASITGIGNGHGIVNLIAVAQRSIGPITGRSKMKGNGIENSRINANDGSIGAVEGHGGVAGGHGIHETFLKAVGEIKLLRGITNANEGDGLNVVDARAGVFGSIEATVLGGKGGSAQVPMGSGIVLSNFKGYNDTTAENISYVDAPEITTKNDYFGKNGIGSIKVDVRSIYGLGIDRSIFEVKGNIGLISSRAFANHAIHDSEFTVNYGDIKQIAAESLNAGNALNISTFISDNGSIGNGTLGITARSSGLTALDHAINGCTFEADIDIGWTNPQKRKIGIKAETKGGVAIHATSVLADANFDNLGRIANIIATTKGQHRKASAAIKSSDFTAAHIDRVEANVDDFSGGDAIEGSEFTARTATYDPSSGAVNNKGSIGEILVTNGSRIGDGVANSTFLAGAAGSIGTINIDVISKKLNNPDTEYNRAASGRAIHRSEFRASALDPDQTDLRGTIGAITVKTGRVIPESLPDLLLPPNSIPPNDQSSLEGAGINASYFAAYGGIGQITVESIGTAVFGSAFVAHSDPLNSVAGLLVNSLAQQRGPGRIAGINIKSTGIYGTGTLMSLFAGSGMGNVSVDANGFPIPDPTAWTRQLQNLGNLANALQSGQILPIMQGAGQTLLNFLTAPISVSSSPVTLTAFVAIRDNIGTITFTNTARYGNYPFLGSLVYARGSYGPVTTTPRAVKAPADELAEGYLASIGFQTPNVFTIYPLPTTFIGTRQAGGNLPLPLYAS